MAILEELIAPLQLQDFLNMHYARSPFAAPLKAKRFCDLISWPLMTEIIDSGHDDCWLVKEGFMHKNPELSTGRLQVETAKQEFQTGHTVLVRHAEKSHPKLAEIADDFRRLFFRPVDIQLYCTPANEEGFNWHYDLEDVFVLQSKGEKEFRLKPNSVNPNPLTMPKDLEFHKEKNKTEIRCWLKAGDWLYIPKGYWHKAKALTDSFHLSVGVLNPEYINSNYFYKADSSKP